MTDTPEVCDVCGYGGARTAMIQCSADISGALCQGGTQLIAEDISDSAATDQADMSREDKAALKAAKAKLQMMSSTNSAGSGSSSAGAQSLRKDAPKPLSLLGRMDSNGASSSSGLELPSKSSIPTTAAAQSADASSFKTASDSDSGAARLQAATSRKRPNILQPSSLRPATKPKLEGPSASASGGGGTSMSLVSATLHGLKREEQRHKAYRAEGQLQAGQPHAESESGSEQRLKQRARKSHREVQVNVMWEHQQAVIAASTKGKPLWLGDLVVQLGPEQSIIAKVSGYGVVGNVHAMDAAVRLPRGTLSGSLLKTWDTLEMSPVEAGENAALIFQAADEGQQAFLDLLHSHMFPNGQLVQVLLGEDKPVWMALLPGPNNVCLGAFVRFSEQWLHSEKLPEKGLLKQSEAKPEAKPKRRQIKWPDESRSTLRATACERGPGQVYRPSHVFHGSQEDAMDIDEISAAAAAAPRVLPTAPELGPLADLNVAIVGFLRDHEAIRSLRKSLKEAGAQTFTNNNPWPGCVNVIVFPEQLVEKDLGLENHSPKEMQAIKEFLLAGSIRLFMRIDYLNLCCQLGRRLTPEEEMKHRVQELLPDGIAVTADTAGLHAAATTSSREGGPCCLEEILEELQAGAGSPRKEKCVWMLSITDAHIKGLEGVSPAWNICQKWLQGSKHCTRIDSKMATPDPVLNALRMAHFYRWYCRHTVVLVRPQDTELIAAAESKKTVHCVTVDAAPSFLRRLRTLK